MYLCKSDGGTSQASRGYSQDDNGRDETDTETSNETTSYHDTEASGSSLKDTTDDEDEAASDDGQTTADEIGDITSNDGTEEGTSRQDRGGEGDLGRSNNEVLGVILEGITSKASVLGVVEASVLLDEVGHGEDTTHPTSVISEEDTSKGGEGDNEVGPHGDGRLDAVDISRAGDGNNSSSRHGCRWMLL